MTINSVSIASTNTYTYTEGKEWKITIRSPSIRVLQLEEWTYTYRDGNQIAKTYVTSEINPGTYTDDELIEIEPEEVRNVVRDLWTAEARQAWVDYNHAQGTEGDPE
tara:strand:+ start:89 stop:409 length:321 start_codon:yes stop_codon:yes gene_type:complete